MQDMHAVQFHLYEILEHERTTNLVTESKLVEARDGMRELQRGMRVKKCSVS